MEIKEKIEKRCNLIIDYLSQMEEIMPDNSEEYSKNPIYLNATERLVEKIVDASTDIVAMLCKVENVTSTSVLDFSTMVKALEKKELIDSKKANSLIELYGFRNRIMYNYGENEASAAYEILISEFIPFYQEFVEHVNEKILGTFESMK